jgi:hypothetical protein
MNRFLDLFRHDTPPPPGQIYADDRSALFPNVVSRSPRLKLWPVSEPVPTTGTFLLIGVATWSGYDMKLLDVLEHLPDGPDVIGVFDTDECRSADDFEKRIPGIGLPYQTPGVGLWQDGQPVASGWGHEGRKLICQIYAIDMNRMGKLLDPRSVSA